VFAIVWEFAQPLLFGLIGGEVDIMFITPSLVGKQAKATVYSNNLFSLFSAYQSGLT